MGGSNCGNGGGNSGSNSGNCGGFVMKAEWLDVGFRFRGCEEQLITKAM